MLGHYIIGDKTSKNGIKCQVVMEVIDTQTHYLISIILKPNKVGKNHPEYIQLRDEFGDDFDFDITHNYRSILTERQIRKIGKIYDTILEPKEMAR